jgi:hypothetical protein
VRAALVAKDESETLDEFLRRSKAIAAELLLELLSQIEAGTVTSTPLDLSKGVVLHVAEARGRAPLRSGGPARLVTTRVGTRSEAIRGIL